MAEYFDLVVVVPLEEELHEFMAAFPDVEDRSTSTEWRHVVDSGEPSIRVLVALQDGMGKASASRTASCLMQDYDVGLIVCLGIAGSLSSDMRLGDVCYT